MILKLFICIQVIFAVGSKTASLGAITREVGEDVVFMFNTSTNILEVLWGIRDGDTLNLKLGGLITVDTSSGVQPNLNLPSTSYAGRVSFVGNLRKGQAWFKITNLNISDSNQYMAKIRVNGASGYDNMPVMLTVREAATTTSTKSLSTTLSTTAVTSTRSTEPKTTLQTLINLTARLKVDEEFDKEMENSSSLPFKTFSIKFKDAITRAFKDNSNFKGMNVISLSNGSIYVKFVVFFKEEITYDEACTPLEMAIKDGKLGELKVIPGSLECSKPDSSTPLPPNPTTGVHPGIIAGVVVVGILAIAGLVIAILFVCRKKSSHRDYRGSTGGQKYAMERRAGEPEEQYACVQRSGASGAAIENKDNAPLPQYAAVDKNKKAKKKTRGSDELVYAELDHEHNKSIGARRPSDRLPTNDSNTVYADIQGSQGRQHPQQRQPPRYGNLQAMDYA